MYDYIAFDIDGTLLDTEEALMCSLRRLALEDVNRELTPDELRFAFGSPGEDTLRRLGVADLRRSSRKWIEYFEDCSHSVRPFDGIEDTLARLFENGVTMGIVTSKTREEFAHGFSPFGLNGYFKVVVCADDTERHKPSPEPLLKFLDLAGADRARTMYVGDTLYDAGSAIAARVAFGLALWGAKTAEGIRATHVLHSPAQILDVAGK